jgi:hypothetical protein
MIELVGVTGGGAIVTGQPMARMPSAYELAMLAFTGKAFGRATVAAIVSIQGVRMADSACYVTSPDPALLVEFAFLCLDHLNAHALDGTLAMRGLPARNEPCDECNPEVRSTGRTRQAAA